MKKTDTELLTSICDALAGASTLSIKEAARRKGVTPVSVFAWMNDQTVRLPEYAGEQDVSFRHAIALARKCAMQVATSGGLEHSSFEMVFRAGLPVHEMDPDSQDMSPEERLAFAFEEDGVLRDERGNRVQQMRRVMPDAKHIEKFVEAAKLAPVQAPHIMVANHPGMTDQTSSNAPAPRVPASELYSQRAAIAVADFGAEPAAPVEPEPIPDVVNGLSSEEIDLLRRSQSMSALEADLAGKALAALRSKPGPNLDHVGVGRMPGSGGRRMV